MGIDASLIASVGSARANAIDELETLAKPLKAALGTDVHFSKRGIYFRGKIVEMTAQVGERTFRAKVVGSAMNYSHGAAINGVAMTLEKCTRDQWYDDLESALRAL